MIKKFPSSDLDKFMVRLPEGMRQRIAAAAEENHRTMNAEIVSRIEQSFLTGSYRLGATVKRRPEPDLLLELPNMIESMKNEIIDELKASLKPKTNRRRKQA